MERQQLLYRGVVEALKSAGVQLLRPPVIEAAEGNLAYTVRGREYVGRGGRTQTNIQTAAQLIYGCPHHTHTGAWTCTS